jgi:hypothetical protein
MGKIFFIFAFLLSTSAFAQVSDTVQKVNVIDTLKKDLFTAPDTVAHLHGNVKSLIAPALMIGYGGLSFAIPGLRSFDRYIYREANEHDYATRKHFEDYFQYAPPVLVYGLNIVGIHGKNTFVDRTLIYALSQGMMNLTLFATKNLTHRLRPNNANYFSFPSGHTANSFAGAEFMAQELNEKSIGYGIAGYTIATITGTFRIFHQDHWFSDVVAGAGVGILSTKAAYLLYPIIRNRLTRSGREKENQRQADGVGAIKKPHKNIMLLPSFDNGAMGLQFAMQL